MANELLSTRTLANDVAKKKKQWQKTMISTRTMQMRLLSTRTMANDVAKHKNNESEATKHKIFAK